MTLTRRKKNHLSRKHGQMSKKKRYNKHSKRSMKFYRGKGIHPRPPSFLPIPPPRPPSIPFPPPRPPSMPKLPASNLPIPPPPNPLFIEPSLKHFIIRSPSSPSSPPKLLQKKPKAKQPEIEHTEPKQVLESEIPKQRRSLRQIIINSDQNKKVKRR